jgi:uncharacterized protein with PQ loop repeat
MELSVIGYLATSTSIIAFGSQFVHTIQTKSTAGLSLCRTVLDVVSLALWLFYAARSEDIPLLIATGCELVTSVSVCVLILKNRSVRFVSVKDYTPPPSPPSEPKSVIIEVAPERRNSV